MLEFISCRKKLNTEYNLVNLPSLLSTESSYCIDYTNNLLKFVLGGYYFEASVEELSLTSTSNLWAAIRLEDSAIYNDGQTIENTKVLANFNTGSVGILDIDGKFYGIAFFDSDPTKISDITFNFSNQLLKNGTLINTSPLILEYDKDADPQKILDVTASLITSVNNHLFKLENINYGNK